MAWVISALLFTFLQRSRSRMGQLVLSSVVFAVLWVMGMTVSHILRLSLGTMHTILITWSMLFEVGAGAPLFLSALRFRIDLSLDTR